jgi:hypothetical protein
MRKTALLSLCLVFCCCRSRQPSVAHADGKTGAEAVVPRSTGKKLGNDNPPSLFPVRADGKFGYIDKKGKLVVKPEFAGGSRFSEGLAAVQLTKGGRVGFIDETGNLVIPIQFDLADPFSEGYAAVMKNRKWGFIDRTGQIVIPIALDAAELFSGGAAAVARIETTNATTFFYINRNGEPLLEKKYFFETALPFGEGLAPVRSMGQYFRYIDQSGNTVIQPKPNETQFMSAGVFAEGLAPVNVRASEGMRWGFIDKSGKMSIRPHFVAAISFTEGLAAVQLLDGKWGYINNKGSMVITPRFDNAGPFFNGMAEVGVGSEYAYIDPTGKYVWGPK